MNSTVALPQEQVPADRIVDVDMLAVPGGAQDAQKAWRALGSKYGLIWTPRQKGHWIATNGAVVEQIYRSPDLFSSSVPNLPPEPLPFKFRPLQLDGHEHRVFRAIIDPALRPAAVQSYAVRARKLAIDLIEGFWPTGECEFVADFALVMPLSVFLWMVDLPMEDRAMLQRWVHAATRGKTRQAIEDAHISMFGYESQRLAESRAKPGDDIVSQVIRAEVDGRPLSEEEQLGTSVLLMAAGLDTVAAMMSFVMHYLARHPAVRRWIMENPSQVSVATEELMRRHGVANNTRTATQDVEIDGVMVHKGEHVLLPNCVHGLDENLFPNPEEIDFTRKPGLTGTFGFGPHRCAGANLARMEMRILLQEWLSRIPDFEVDPKYPVIHQTAQVNGIEMLPLRRETGSGRRSR